ncbi:putative 3-demethylubiquinone-9 3-methyltransferase (glyoxalase superfamily) [Catalinimonas alkaloidigena]|uniref:VOC family protein n=1 Tax=Catalinimonas alkaloidigena TaxID=1075417 RepID=UPI0024051DE3|nr:VOC family protein [Catalinimonas alkaloidigena]MDF9798704.1 putative 3-demethylubiquinone-9 3-methyltransferase (glyoxalase superfamily) [Catalinimonas alkaloidigena]
MTDVKTMQTQKITTNLWFDHQAEEAVKFYTSIFKNSETLELTRFGKEGHEIHGKAEGTVMTISFQLEGQEFVALNGGPQFKFTPSVSFFIYCESRAEVDSLWRELSDEGFVMMPLQQYPFSEYYGWVQDKYGVSWQLILADQAEIKQKIVPCLLFVGDQAGKVEEAMQFYTSVFEQAEIKEISRYEKGQDPNMEGAINYAAFRLNGQEFKAMDSYLEHGFTFNEATSFIIHCKDQEEVDYYWNTLAEGGDEKAQACGWLKDKYGLSWQVVPTILHELLSAPDSSKSQNVTRALLQMKKLDVAALKQAYEQA